MRWTLAAVVLALLPVAVPAAGQEPGRIVGSVTESGTSRPLVGVQVVVQEGQRGALTGPDGRYVISGVPAGTHTVRTSLLGFGMQEATVTVAAGAAATADFQLSPAALELDEVVVVGYGTQRRRDVTGSVASVNAERLQDVPMTDVSQALQGVVPGVAVSSSSAGAEGSSSIRIRGQGSLSASSSPLIVLDGIPYPGDLAEINPGDIESIDILRDASSAAIYGSRASNGVILVTTKKGIGEPRFSYDGYAGVQNIVNVPDLMTGPEFADFKCQRINAGQVCDAAMMADALTPSEYALYQAGEWTNWSDLAVGTGNQQQHTISVSGGEGGTRYFITGSLLDVAGVAKGDEFSRASMRLNLDQDVRDWLSVGTSTQFTWADRSGIPADFEFRDGGAYYMNPLTRAFNEDGTQVVTPWPDDPFWNNPLQGLLAENEDITRRLFTSNYLQVELPQLPGFTYRLNAGIDVFDRGRGTYWGRNTRRGLDALGAAETIDNSAYDWTLENIVRYAREIGVHNFDVTGVFSAQKERSEQRRFASANFPGDELTYWQPQVALSFDPSFSFSEAGMVSQMARLNYAYDGRYLATFTARRDGASVFGENNKYGIFPSIALGWNVSEESFWPASDNFNVLKLRASWGVNGNQALSPYQTLSRLSESSYVDGSTTWPGYFPSSLGSPDLRWERSEALNFGIDFGLFTNRVAGTIDLYQKRTTDLLLDRLIPSTHGVTRITENMGEIRNRGAELRLTTINVEGDRFGWTSDFNISANRNEIIDLYGDGTDDVANSWFIGQPIQVNYGYVHDGIWQVGDDIASSAQPDAKPGDVRVRDTNGDGQINASDRTILSDREPDYIAGLTNTLTYGDLSLSFFLYTVQGVERNNSMLDLGQSWNDVRRNIPRLDYWTADRPSSVIPANRYDSNLLGVGMYQDASFLRLKDATLAYTLPLTLQERLRVDNLRVYLSGRNLWTHTSWDGLDPELGGQYAIPLERTFVAGINFSF